MATTKEYADFVCERVMQYGMVRAKKMFGEYMVYVDDRPILLLCDNTVFVKKLPEITALLQDASCGYPYKGAKEHYILDIENEALTGELIPILREITPLPKPKKKKTVGS